MLVNKTLWIENYFTSCELFVIAVTFKVTPLSRKTGIIEQSNELGNSFLADQAEKRKRWKACISETWQTLATTKTITNIEKVFNIISSAVMGKKGSLPLWYPPKIPHHHQVLRKPKLKGKSIKLTKIYQSTKTFYN